MGGNWIETTVENEAEHADLAGKLNQGTVFAVHDGEMWIVYWNELGNEYWMAPPTEDWDSTGPAGRFASGEDQEYPITYVHRDDSERPQMWHRYAGVSERGYTVEMTVGPTTASPVFGGAIEGELNLKYVGTSTHDPSVAEDLGDDDDDEDDE